MSSARSHHMRQQTLARPASISGKGLFHGIDAKLRLLPAKAGTGIAFRRTDLAARPLIQAHIDNVTSATRRTVLRSRNGATVETVEHLLAALAGLGVDNCIVEINALEVPGVLPPRDVPVAGPEHAVRSLDDPHDNCPATQALTLSGS